LDLVSDFGLNDGICSRVHSLVARIFEWATRLPVILAKIFVQLVDKFMLIWENSMKKIDMNQAFYSMLDFKGRSSRGQ